MADAIALMVPGIPMMFEAEEILMEGDFEDNQAQAVNWNFRGDSEGSATFKMYQNAIANRWYYNALRSNNIQTNCFHPVSNVYGFIRRSDYGYDSMQNAPVMVITNLSNEDFMNGYTVDCDKESGRWECIFNSQSAANGGWEGYEDWNHKPWIDNGRLYLNKLPKECVLAYQKIEGF